MDKTPLCFNPSPPSATHLLLLQHLTSSFCPLPTLPLRLAPTSLSLPPPLPLASGHPAPLFETLDDLENAPGTTTTLFSNAWHLKHINGMQECMNGEGRHSERGR